MKNLRRTILYSGLSLLLFGICAVVGRTPLFRDLEQRSIDLRFRIRGTIAVSPDIVLVEIDDATVGAYGQYPIPRAQIALLLQALREANARVIAVDVLFSGYSRPLLSQDSLLSMLTGASNNVVHAVDIPFYSPHSTPGLDWSSEQRLHSCSNLGGSDDLELYSGDPVSATFPNRDLWEAGHAIGNIALLPDRDGVVRATPLLVKTGSDIIPSFALEVLRLWLDGGACTMQYSSGTLTVTGSKGTARLPCGTDASALVNYAGKNKCFEHYSFLDVLRGLTASGSDPRSVSRNMFTNRLVLIGVTSSAAEYGDLGPTPFGVLEPQVYVHAHMLSAALTSRMLRSLSTPIVTVALIALALALGAIFAQPQGIQRGIALGGLVIVTVAVPVAAFCLIDVVVPTVIPLLGFAATSLGFLSAEYLMGQKDRRRLRAERHAAAEIQRNLLPSSVPTAPGWDFSAVYIPSQEVGGDYYDLFEIGENRLALIVADVSGKGLSAALLMANFKGIVRSELAQNRPIAESVSVINRSICRELSQSQFVTAFFSILDLRTGRMDYANAGHNPPIVLTPNGEVETVATGDLVLGVLPGLEYSSGEITIPEGASLVMYTDGACDSYSTRGEQFGEERLIRVLISHSQLAAEPMVKAILEEIGAFVGRAPWIDDLTLVIVQRRSM